MKELIITLTFLVVLGNVIWGQTDKNTPRVFDPLNEDNYAMLPGNLIQMANEEGERIVFSLSFDQDDWEQFEVLKNDAILIDLQGHEQAIFRICTSGPEDCLFYYVEGANRYEVFWNASLEKWDLNLVLENDR